MLAIAGFKYQATADTVLVATIGGADVTSGKTLKVKFAYVMN